MGLLDSTFGGGGGPGWSDPVITQAGISHMLGGSPMSAGYGKAVDWTMDRYHDVGKSLIDGSLDPSQWGKPGSHGGGGGGGGNPVSDLSKKAAGLDPFGNAPAFGTGAGDLHDFTPASPTQVSAPTAGGLGISRPTIAGPGVMGNASGTVMGAGNDFAGQQQTLAQNLMNQAFNPNAPSVAAMQLQQGQQANLAQQFAMANSGRGGQQGLAMRSAMDNGAQINGNLSQQSAMARLAEQQQAAGLAGNVIQGGRGQSLEQGISAAGLQQDAMRQTYGAGLQTNLAQGQLDQGYNGTLLGVGGLDVNAGIANQNAGVQTQGQVLAGDQMHNGNLVSLYGIKNGLIGNTLMAGGTGLAGLAKLLQGSPSVQIPGSQPADNGQGGGDTTPTADGENTPTPVGSETANGGAGDMGNDAGSYNTMGLYGGPQQGSYLRRPAFSMY